MIIVLQYTKISTAEYNRKFVYLFPNLNIQLSKTKTTFVKQEKYLRRKDISAQPRRCEKIR